MFVVHSVLGRWVLVLAGMNSVFWLPGCGGSEAVDARVESLSVQPNPVPAPTAAFPSRFTVTWKADTQGQTYGYTFVMAALSAAGAAGAVQGIDFGRCSKGCDILAEQQLQCTSSLSGTSSTDRIVTCDDPTLNQQPVKLVTGSYQAGIRVYEDPSYAIHDKTFSAHSEQFLELK